MLKKMYHIPIEFIYLLYLIDILCISGKNIK